MNTKKPPEGEHYYKVFHCYGCQSCYELGPDDSLLRHPHVLSSEDVTEEINQLKTKHANMKHVGDGVKERNMTTQDELIDAAEKELIDTAEKYATLYDDDDRECIKTDVMNAFFAGSAYATQRMEHVGWRIRIDNNWTNVQSFTGEESDWAKKLYAFKDQD